MIVEEAVRKPKERNEILCFMIDLCMGAGEQRAAEGYLLELLAWVAFAPHDQAPLVVN